MNFEEWAGTYEPVADLFWTFEDIENAWLAAMPAERERCLEIGKDILTEVCRENHESPHPEYGEFWIERFTRAIMEEGSDEL